MTEVVERHEALAAAFESFRHEAAFGADSLRRVRERAFDRFAEAGFPSTRDEEWRFTNVAPIARTTFVRPGRDGTAVARGVLEPYRFAEAGAEIVVVNGHVAPWSASPALPSGVSFGRLADAIAHGIRLPEGARPFADLNTAFFDDCVVLHIAPHAAVREPIHVLHFSTSAGAPLMASPRLLVLAGERSEATVIESYAGAGSGVTLTNAVTEFALQPGALVEHIKVQREAATAFHMASQFAHLGRGATLASRSLVFGGHLVRNDVVAVLAGEGAECTLNGLYIATGDTLVDTHTTIDHAKPHCPSHEVYKGILAGKSRAVFNGKIIVRQDAQKTDAKQTNKALLLTDDAQINTKPQLEIFADDVKCTHGAAIGQLDEDAMFYLRARGISVESARNMMIHAFAGDVLNGIRVDAVREAAVTLMEQKLRLSHEV